MDIKVVHKISEELELSKLLGKHSSQILILVYSHLLTKRSINKLEEWIGNTELLEIMGLEKISTKELYESLDHLNEMDFEDIEKNIRIKWEKIEKTKDVLVIDVTDTYFNGSQAEWKSRKGKDGKYDKLIQIGLGVTFNNGFPIFHKQYEGNINNVKIFQDMLSDIRYNKYRCIIMDRGMSSKENIEEIKACQLEAILGIRQSHKYQQEFLDTISRDEIYCKERQVQLKETAVYIKSFDYNGGKLIAIYNPALEVIKREKYYSNKEVSEVGTKYLGYSLIYHNTTLEDRVVVKKYFEKDIVERSFKQMKGALSLRPIRVWLLKHVEAHIKISYLSYCILSLLGYKLKSIDLSPIDALDKLRTSYKVHLKESSSNFEWEKIVTQSKIQNKILDCLGVVYKI
jgi:transposase